MNMRYRLFHFALLALALTSCAESSSQQPGNEPDKGTNSSFNKVFSAYCQDGGGTKTTLKEDNSVAFQSGDAISIFDVSIGETVDECTCTNVRFNMSGSPENDGSATFAGTLQNEMSSYIAIYPYQEGANLEVIGVQGRPTKYNLHAIIPAVQTATAGTFDPSANVSIAKSVRSGDRDVLRMMNICALVKFKVPEGESYTKVAFVANNGEPLAGSYLVSTAISATDSPSYTYTGVSDNESSSVTLTGGIESGKWYYIAVSPVTLDNGFSIRLYDTDTHYSTKGVSKKVELKRSVILNLGEVSGDWLGNGTFSDPYLISSYQQLKLLAKRFSTAELAETWAGKYYRQTRDIDCQGEYIHIGGLDENEVNRAVDVFFVGNYDGDSHKITNFRLKGQDHAYGATQYYGLFSQVKNSSFYNIYLEPASIFENPTRTSWVSTQTYFIGPLIASALSDDNEQGIIVENCHVSADSRFAMLPSANITNFGGLVGYCSEKLEMTDCTNDMDLLFYNDRGQINGGGLVGILSAPLSVFDYNIISKISNCRNTGNIEVQDVGGSGQSVASGVVAMVLETSRALTIRISNCVNNGNVSASTEGGNSYAAGIVAFQDCDGDLSNDPYIYNCLNTGNINATGGDGSLSGKTGTFAGGICGFVYDNDTQLALCANTGNISISGDNQVGAITGSYGACIWCYWLNAQSHTSGASPALPCTVDGTSSNCYFYPTLGADTMNNRRTGSDGNGGTDIVLSESNTQWAQLQWEIAPAWTGKSFYGGSSNTLDIEVVRTPEF